MSSAAYVMRWFVSRCVDPRIGGMLLGLAVASCLLDRPQELTDHVLRSLALICAVLALRGMDDLFDLPLDRWRHPDRILVQAPSVAPFVATFALLGVLSASLFAVVHGLAVAFVAAGAGVLWATTVYGGTHPRQRSHPFWHVHALYVKYPALLLLAIGPGAAWRPVSLLAAVMTYSLLCGLELIERRKELPPLLLLAHGVLLIVSLYLLEWIG